MGKTHSCLTEDELVKLASLATWDFIDDPVFCLISKNSKSCTGLLCVCIKCCLRCSLLQVAYDAA